MPFLLTTDQNTEDLVADEIREHVPDAGIIAGPYGAEALVRVDGVGVDLLLGLRTIHDVIDLRHESEGTSASLEEIRDAIREVAFPELEHAASFRVSSTRVQGREFNRQQLQGAAGAVLHERYGTSVDLEEFAVNVRVNLCDTHLVAGVQVNRDPLGNRIRRARSLRTGLKPTLAVAMLRMVGAHRGPGRLLDPMCGSGTIPIEARGLNPQLEIHASDWDEPTCEVARETIANHALEIDVRTTDARQAAAIYRRPFDYIVTDPPYGVRQARRTDLTRLYEGLLASFDQLLAPGGKIAMLVLRYHSFLRALRGSRLQIVHERLTEAGGLHPRIFLLERRGDRE